MTLSKIQPLPCRLGMGPREAAGRSVRPPFQPPAWWRAAQGLRLDEDTGWALCWWTTAGGPSPR